MNGVGFPPSTVGSQGLQRPRVAGFQRSRLIPPGTPTGHKACRETRLQTGSSAFQSLTCVGAVYRAPGTSRPNPDPGQSADSPQEVRARPSDPKTTNGRDGWNSNDPGRCRAHQTTSDVRAAIHELPLTAHPLAESRPLVEPHPSAEPVETGPDRRAAE